MTNPNVTLPLLPLKSGVVLPGMVFTMALESDEARVAVEAAQWPAARPLGAPHPRPFRPCRRDCRSDGGRGRCPAASRRGGAGDQRATIGTGAPGTGDALWVEAEPLEEGEPTPAVAELAREYRSVLENILLSRGARQVAAQSRDVTEPSRLADVAGYADLSLPKRSKCSRRSMSRHGCAWSSGGPGTPWPT